MNNCPEINNSVVRTDFIVYEKYTLKGDPILGAFLHKILGKVLLMNSLDVSTLFVNQNMSYL